MCNGHVKLYFLACQKVLGSWEDSKKHARNGAADIVSCRFSLQDRYLMNGPLLTYDSSRDGKGDIVILFDTAPNFIHMPHPVSNRLDFAFFVATSEIPRESLCRVFCSRC